MDAETFLETPEISKKFNRLEQTLAMTKNHFSRKQLASCRDAIMIQIFARIENKMASIRRFFIGFTMGIILMSIVIGIVEINWIVYGGLLESTGTMLTVLLGILLMYSGFKPVARLARKIEFLSNIRFSNKLFDSYFDRQYKA